MVFLLNSNSFNSQDMETPTNPTPEKPTTTVEQKLDEVLEVLRKIEKQGQRNFWSGGAKFVILNFAKILASFLTLFFLWKIWGIVGGISESVNFLKESSLGLLEKISSSAGGLKFWQ